jgi:catechol 1,2-dioxygenase
MATSGINGATTHKFDPNFTQNVINATGPKCTPRLRKVMASLIQHIHDFARENEITVDEWMAAVNFVCRHQSQLETSKFI